MSSVEFHEMYQNINNRLSQKNVDDQNYPQLAAALSLDGLSSKLISSDNNF